jgi:hypothetical protein
MLGLLEESNTSKVGDYLIGWHSPLSEPSQRAKTVVACQPRRQREERGMPVAAGHGGRCLLGEFKI